MHDIKFPDSGSSLPGKKPNFEVKHVSEPGEAMLRQAQHDKTAGEHVKVNFGNFVQLVATHNFEEVMQRHADDDVIVSTNLLTDLANAHEEAPQENRKLPVIFVVGIVIGVIVTYLIARL